jgi:2-polyprenyl-3-methyl-5-hydroxy-6-metoxy-1,4-benzoquinol methylase
MTKTVEKQYEAHIKLKDRKGLTKLGVVRSSSWHTDPKRLLFEFSRYKFVAKMFSGKQNVLEVGCGDAFYVRIVQQEVDKVHAIDIDPVFINDAKDKMDSEWPYTCAVHDILSGPVEGMFDAAYSLDVLEHISANKERMFISNIIESLSADGVLIIGMPSLESQVYATELSKIGHVNCKTGNDLKNLLQDYFENVFIFSMNDEVVHTGYQPMAHYLFALCVGKLSR